MLRIEWFMTRWANGPPSTENQPLAVTQFRTTSNWRILSPLRWSTQTPSRALPTTEAWTSVLPSSRVPCTKTTFVWTNKRRIAQMRLGTCASDSTPSCLWIPSSANSRPMEYLDLLHPMTRNRMCSSSMDKARLMISRLDSILKIRMTRALSALLLLDTGTTRRYLEVRMGLIGIQIQRRLTGDL